MKNHEPSRFSAEMPKNKNSISVKHELQTRASKRLTYLILTQVANSPYEECLFASLIIYYFYRNRHISGKSADNNR